MRVRQRIARVHLRQLILVDINDSRLLKQGDHSPGIVKFPDISLTFCTTPTDVALTTTSTYRPIVGAISSL